MAIEGYLHSKESQSKPLIIVGKTNTPHGRQLKDRYNKRRNVRFVDGIYDFSKLDSLRHFLCAYFHGHSVGGTNPSLLEAMAAGCFVFAHDNIFNRAVLKDNALYYHSAEKITEYLNNINELSDTNKAVFINNNIKVIKNEYSWEHLIDEHEKYFLWLLEQR